ncbi:MAG: hypothetical protein KF902_03905 [Phycisphaeraceae bacterium]|nr:hypothetical protein [Phycisphaeraceae bacterium]
MDARARVSVVLGIVLGFVVLGLVFQRIEVVVFGCLVALGGSVAAILECGSGVQGRRWDCGRHANRG